MLSQTFPNRFYLLAGTSFGRPAFTTPPTLAPAPLDQGQLAQCASAPPPTGL